MDSCRKWPFLKPNNGCLTSCRRSLFGHVGYHIHCDGSGLSSRRCCSSILCHLLCYQILQCWFAKLVKLHRIKNSRRHDWHSWVLPCFLGRNVRAIRVMGVGRRALKLPFTWVNATPLSPQGCLPKEARRFLDYEGGTSAGNSFAAVRDPSRGGVSKLWRDTRADRWDWFIRKKFELNGKSPLRLDEIVYRRSIAAGSSEGWGVGNSSSQCCSRTGLTATQGFFFISEDF